MAKFDKQKAKEIFQKFADFMESAGVKLTWGLLVYSIILCVITINLDRAYLGWKLEKSVNNAFSEMGKIFSGDNDAPKKQPKKRKFFTPKPKIISISDVLSKDNSYEINFKKSDFISSLKPPKIREWSIYNYYKPKDNDNLYADIVVDIKNLEGNEIDVSDLLSSIKAVYDKKYEYEGFVVMELADGSDFEESSYKIKPLQTRKIHILVEVPKIAKSDDKPVDLSFDIADQTYILNLKISEEKTEDVKIQHSELPKEEIQVKKQEQSTQNTVSKPVQQTAKPKTVQPVSKSKVVTPMAKPQKSNLDNAQDLLFN